MKVLNEFFTLFETVSHRKFSNLKYLHISVHVLEKIVDYGDNNNVFNYDLKRCVR